MSVHKKLMQARVALQGKPLKKSGNNKFAGYSYFELGDFLPAIQQIFADLGLCGIVSFGETVATLTITDTDGGGSIDITSPMSSAALKGCHEVQNLGAVQTYLRRYLWVTAMEIVEHDALDATTGAQQPEQRLSVDEVVTSINACQTVEAVRAMWPVIKTLPQALRKRAEDAAKSRAKALEQQAAA